MPQHKHIEAVEKRLWLVVDTLRANAVFASCLPFMGLVYLRHAHSRSIHQVLWPDKRCS